MAAAEAKEDTRLARHGFEFLRDRMWDAGDGGFWWLVANEGAPPRSDGPDVSGFVCVGGGWDWVGSFVWVYIVHR